MTIKPDVSVNRHAPFVEVRTNDDGTLDEIVAKGVTVHIEQMSDTEWWMGIYKGKKRQRVVFFTDRAHIAAMTEED